MITTHKPKPIRLTPTAMRLAPLVRMGGWYVDTELIEQLGGVDVSTYYRALHQLADLGMITYTDRNRGPQSPYSYRRIDPIVTSTMWDVLGLRIFGVGA